MACNSQAKHFPLESVHELGRAPLASGESPESKRRQARVVECTDVDIEVAWLDFGRILMPHTHTDSDGGMTELSSPSYGILPHTASMTSSP